MTSWSSPCSRADSAGCVSTGGFSLELTRWPIRYKTVSPRSGAAHRLCWSGRGNLRKMTQYQRMCGVGSRSAGKGTKIMGRTRFILVAVSLGLFSSASTEAWAQGPNRSVSRPALSPYLNMFRNDIGFTDPYNSLVRPYLPPSERVRRDATAPMDRTANPQAAPELMRNRASDPRSEGTRHRSHGNGQCVHEHGALLSDRQQPGRQLPPLVRPVTFPVRTTLPHVAHP